MAVYVKDKSGNRVKAAGLGARGPAGKSAYRYAAEGGFSGSEDQFAALLGTRSNPNLLDNWYFADPVNQKGRSEYTAGRYIIDRWDLSADSLRVEDDGLVIENGESENTGLHQPVEAKRLIPGRVYTISVLVKELDGGAQLTFWGKDYVNIKPGVTSYTFIHTGEEEATFAYPVVRLHGSVKAVAAKLEPGPVQTLARRDEDGNWALNDPPPDKGLELLKCQRYYQIFATQSMRPAKAEDFRPPMRVKPALGTITINGATYYAADANL